MLVPLASLSDVHYSTPRTTRFVCDIVTVAITLTDLLNQIERSPIDPHVSQQETDYELAAIVSSLIMSLLPMFTTAHPSRHA